MSLSGEMMEMAILNVEFFNHQIIAIFPQNTTEIVRFFKTYQIWVFFEKNRSVFFRKELDFFQNR